MGASERPRALISDALSERAVEVLSRGGIDADFRPGLGHDELLRTIDAYDVLLVRSKTEVGEDVLERAERLKLIGRAGIGVDNIDVKAATRRGIFVVNTPGGNAVSAAEHTIALLMALARNVPQATRSLREGRWEKSRFTGTQLTGCTLGVLGFGSIGRLVAKRAACLGMEVLVYDPFVSDETVADEGAEAAELDAVLAAADFVTVHMPLTPETRGFVGVAELAKMKAGARLVHCARGGIVDEAALHTALVSGRLAGAALDVFAQEPPPADHPLLRLDNVIVTPHLGGSTVEAQEAVAIRVAEEAVRFFATGTVASPVNAPRVRAEMREKLAPFMELGEKLGSFLAQLSRRGVDRMDILYVGQLFERDSALIKASVLKGFLARLVERPVNVVNAPLLAAERGLRVVEQRQTQAEGAFHTVLEVTVGRGSHSHSAAATVFPGGEQRIVRTDGVRAEVPTEGNLLLMWNRDVPGVVGAVGTVLGNARVNIMGMQVGHDPSRGMARSFWSLDRPVGDVTLDAIRDVDNVLEATLVRL